MSELKKDEIFAKLPDHFWSAFAGELVAVFGIDIFDKDEDGFRNIEYMGGTSGWVVALETVCHRLDIDWFYEWYDALDWMDSDEFDSDLLDGMYKQIGSYEACMTNAAYYRWLVRKMRKDAKVEAEAEN